MRSFASVFVLTALSLALIGCESQTSTAPGTGAAATTESSTTAAGKPAARPEKKALPRIRKDL
jgi:hypothetical protein